MLSHLADVSIRALVVAAIAAGVAWFPRSNRSAAMEHAVWTAVVGGMLALMVFGAALPRLPVPLPVLGRTPVPMRAAAPVASEPRPLPVKEAATPGPVAPVARRQPMKWDEIAEYAYAAIALALLARLAIGMFLAGRLAARGKAAGDFRVCDSIAVPLTVGWFRAKILLPAEWREWDQPKLASVLAHEGSHVGRRDGLIAALAAINRSIFWFHPLAWWLERRLGLLAELACDEACVAELGDRRQYATLLLDMARVVDGSQGRLRQQAFPMAARSHLRQRIDSILKEGRKPSRGLQWTAWAAIAACGIPMLLGAGTIALVGPTPQPPLLMFQRPSYAPPPPPPPRARLKFEVASIRPAAPRSGSSGGGGDAPPPPPLGGAGCAPARTMDAGRIDLQCATLRALLSEGFGVPSARLLAPDWTETDAFDISAKFPDGATRDQLPEMFQALLEDRFRLIFHRESKDGPVNALVVSKGGLKVKPAAPDSAQPAWVSAAAVKEPYNVGSPVAVLQSSSMGFVRRSNTGGPGGIIHYEAPSITFEGLAALVKLAGPGMDPAVGIVDMTGLKGRYQVNLDVNMTDVVAAIVAGPRDPANAQGAWLNAVQDGLKKLGLQLEPRRTPVESIVIDHLEKAPTAN